jgi:hypothetical protein
MSSVKRLFERHSDSARGIGTPNAWRGFESDLVGFGLGSPALQRVLSQAWAGARADGRAVAYADLVSAAASFSPDDEAEKIVQDLRQDATALRRFVDYVRSKNKRVSKERRLLELGA